MTHSSSAKLENTTQNWFRLAGFQSERRRLKIESVTYRERVCNGEIEATLFPLRMARWLGAMLVGMSYHTQCMSSAVSALLPHTD